MPIVFSLFMLVRRKGLADKGIKFVSETDTEVIAQLIGVYMDEGLDTKDAVKSALQR